MIKKTVLLSIAISASCHLVNAQEVPVVKSPEVPAIKSTDPLVGKGIFQGNLNVNLQNVKTTQERPIGANPNSPLSINLNRTVNIGTNGLFGRIDGNKYVFSIGYNLNVATERRYSFLSDGSDTSYKYETTKWTLGPTFGSGKFITITDDFYLAPTSTFNVYAVVEKNNARYPYQSNSNNKQIETKNSIGAGASVNIIPLRIAYLWKEKILLTTSIGAIGFQFEYQKSKGEVTSQYYSGNPGSYNTYTTKLNESKFNANIIGSISNYASFGISYLFK
jgi:hypothetical protein